MLTVIFDGKPAGYQDPKLHERWEQYMKDHKLKQVVMHYQNGSVLEVHLGNAPSDEK